MEYLHEDLTRKIIECFYSVYNRLGYGFLEKVYERSMLVELTAQGLKASDQVPISVQYRGRVVGRYVADIIVEDVVILEIKAAEFLIEEHTVQLLNYLRSTDKEIGLVLNFGKKPEICRKIFTNDRKKHLERMD